jgi:hypothetical protein
MRDITPLRIDRWAALKTSAKAPVVFGCLNAALQVYGLMTSFTERSQDILYTPAPSGARAGV